MVNILIISQVWNNKNYSLKRRVELWQKVDDEAWVSSTQHLQSGTQCRAQDLSAFSGSELTFFTQPTLSHSNDLTHAVCLLLPPLLLKICRQTVTDTVKHTHTRLTALCPGLPGWAGTRKVKPIWILLKQETVSGSAISWAICSQKVCIQYR